MLAPRRPPRPLSPGRNLRASRAVPAASFRAPGARDLEGARLEPRRALSETRAALAAAGGKAHASGGGSPRPASRRGGETWQELTVCPRSRVCARLPSPTRLPRSPPPAPRAPPGRGGGRFPGTFQESASRDRSPRQLFKEARAANAQASREPGGESQCGCWCWWLWGGSLRLRPPLTLHLGVLGDKEKSPANA